MLKVILKFIAYCTTFLFFGCYAGDKEPIIIEIEHYKDSVSEARIDSAYKAIKSDCDTLMIYGIPQMVDSFLKDSALLSNFFDTTHVFHDTDKKVEKVIRQLQADCAANLLKETYRKARLRQKLKPVRRKG